VANHVGCFGRRCNGFQKGIAGCAVILDPARAKPLLDWAPGKFVAMDDEHADVLVDMGAVDPARLMVPLRRAA
jgi:hypothetical protein